MKPKLVISVLFLGGSAVLIVTWTWALAAGANLTNVALATLFTAFLSVTTGLLASRRSQNDSRLSDGAMSAGRLIALTLIIMGTMVSIFGYIPSKTGHGSHVDRRYAMLFFALAAYAIIFAFLSRSRSGRIGLPIRGQSSQSSRRPKD
ncbi:MAG: hypothetical protein JSS11_01655 [Verrucomicrobia bacterium]|nr:hypothetical protein [Verrucomicrobiota bacterium]